LNFNHILITVEKTIAHIVLNRPKVLNALNRELVSELHDAVRNIRENSAIRVLVISGSEKNFAAGADIAPMAELAPLEAREFCFNDAFNALEDLPIPVIAAISGYALGGGLELALACDFRICSEDAKLGSPEIKLGIFPGAGGTQRLPKLIGISRAKEMIFLGRNIDARTALDYGLCDKVVQGDPVEEAYALASQLAERPPVALQNAKRVINYGIGRELRTGIEFEEEIWADLFMTEDQKEGMKAFLEKRKPNFKGR
jgi:enoyl-CoA hydratase